MEARAYRPSDLPHLARLANRFYAGRYEYIPHSARSLKARFSDNTGVFVVTNQGIEGFGALASRPWGDEIQFLCVRRGRLELQVKDLLLSRLEGVATSGRILFVLEDEDALIPYLKQRGYRQRGGLFHWLTSLTSFRPVPQITGEIVLRSLRADEEAALVGLVNRGYGFRRLEAGVLARWKGENPSFSHDWVHVAEHGGRLVSAVCTRPDTEHNRYFRARRGYMGPATTLKSFARRGLARALTVRALNHFRKQGLNAASLYTLDHNRPSMALVSSLGFEAKHHWKLLRKKTVIQAP